MAPNSESDQAMAAAAAICGWLDAPDRIAARAWFETYREDLCSTLAMGLITLRLRDALDVAVARRLRLLLFTIIQVRGHIAA